MRVVKSENYKAGLRFDLQEKKRELKNARKMLQDGVFKDKEWFELVNKINNLSVDVATIISRLENIGKSVYLPQNEDAQLIYKSINK